MLKNLTRANERCVAFGYEIVVENRACVRFSEESVWSVIGGRTRDAPVCDDKFNGVEHIHEKTSSESKVCSWGGGSCEGGRRRVRWVGITHPAEEGVGV